MCLLSTLLMIVPQYRNWHERRSVEKHTVTAAVQQSPAVLPSVTPLNTEQGQGGPKVRRAVSFSAHELRQTGSPIVRRRAGMPKTFAEDTIRRDEDVIPAVWLAGARLPGSVLEEPSLSSGGFSSLSATPCTGGSTPDDGGTSMDQRAVDGDGDIDDFSPRLVRGAPDTGIGVRRNQVVPVSSSMSSLAPAAER